MGVSLERVQFKFASIVGELCNEPDVLSQFAVWLDLRLAEYKLKGNISLDCSGEEPDPIWLKGLNKGKTNKSRKTSHTGVPGSSPSHSRNSSSHHYSSHYPSAEQDSSQHYSSDHYTSQDISHSVLERTSPEVVLVKEESEEVFPVSLHYTDPQGHDSRKRQMVDATSYGDSQWSTPSKQRRFSQPSESPSNQSLMSVISGYQGNTPESDSKGDNSSFVLPSTSSMGGTDLNTDSFIESVTDTSFNDKFTENSWENQQGTNSNTSKGNGTDTKCYDYASLLCSVANMVLLEDGSLGKIYHRMQPEEMKQRAIIKAQIPMAGQMPKPSLKNLLSSVRTFQRWLWHGPPAESRTIHQIPPPELDQYLVKFYQTIKSPRGDEYKVQSKMCLRSNIDRYLRDTGYPARLSSRCFQNSQHVFKLWTKLV